MTDNKILEQAKRLKEFRFFLKKTQLEMAKEAKIHAPNLSRGEAGVRKIPTGTIIALEDAYNLNRKWLLTGEGEMFKKPDGEQAKGDYPETEATTSIVASPIEQYNVAQPKVNEVENLKDELIRSLKSQLAEKERAEKEKERADEERKRADEKEQELIKQKEKEKERAEKAEKEKERAEKALQALQAKLANQAKDLKKEEKGEMSAEDIRDQVYSIESRELDAKRAELDRQNEATERKIEAIRRGDILQGIGREDSRTNTQDRTGKTNSKGANKTPKGI